MNEEAIKTYHPNQARWLLEVPYDWRDKASCEFVQQWKTQKSLGKTNKDFKMAYKTKKSLRQTVEVDKKHWHSGSIFPQSWKPLPPLSPLGIQLPSVPAAIKLMYSRYNQSYSIAVPEHVKDVPASRSVCDNQASSCRMIFLDPGVRTFQTGFDTTGNVLEFGVGYNGIFNRCLKIDRIYGKSQAQKLPHRTRHHLRYRVLPRYRARLKNVVHDLHSKLAKFLCENYDDIHLPLFEVSRMVSKKHLRRCLNSKTVRMMLTWKHFAFRELLKHKCLLSGSRLHVCNEAYTSKTCYRCGFVTKGTSSKTFRCSECSLVCDRDINGAINIMLRQCAQAQPGYLSSL